MYYRDKLDRIIMALDYINLQMKATYLIATKCSINPCYATYI